MPLTYLIFVDCALVHGCEFKHVLRVLREDSRTGQRAQQTIQGWPVRFGLVSKFAAVCGFVASKSATPSLATTQILLVITAPNNICIKIASGGRPPGLVRWLIFVLNSVIGLLGPAGYGRGRQVQTLGLDLNSTTVSS